MRSLIFSWLIFQILVGIWLFISPFAFGNGGTPIAINNMIFGALVVILGVGTAFFEFYHKERVGEMEHVRERA